jgi:hypothetical protein
MREGSADQPWRKPTGSANPAENPGGYGPKNGGLAAQRNSKKGRATHVADSAFCPAACSPAGRFAGLPSFMPAGLPGDGIGRPGGRNPPNSLSLKEELDRAGNYFFLQIQ